MTRDVKQLLQSTHLSHSRLQTYQQCPQRFKIEYLDEQKGAPSVEMQLGSVVHAVLADYLESIQGKPQVFQPTRAELAARIPGVYSKLRKDGSVVSDVNVAKVEGLLEGFVTWAPQIDGRAILHVEAKRRTKLGEYTLLSILDLVLANERQDIQIIDFKTGKSQYVKEDQLRTYSLPILGSREHNGTPVKASYVFLRDGEVRSYSIRRDECDGIVADIMAIVRTIEKDESFQPNVSRLCAWCGVKKWCSAFRMDRPS